MDNNQRVYELERRNDGTPPSNTLKDDDGLLAKGVKTGAIHSKAGFNNPLSHQYPPVLSNAFTDFTQKQSPYNSPNIFLLSHWVLTHNYISFNNKFWHQLKGTAMGTSFAVRYANIVIFQIERKALNTCTQKPLLYKRFVDDIIAIMPTKNSGDALTHALNAVNPAIQFTAELDEHHIDFLDITIYKGDNFIINNKFDTKVFQKPINLYCYLPPSSYHTHSIFRSFITGEINRYRLLCTDDTEFNKIKSLFIVRLLLRGYNKHYLSNIINNLVPPDRLKNAHLSI